LISFIAASIISNMSGYVLAQPCPLITQSFENDVTATLHFYPECENYYNGANQNQYAIITANINGTAIEAGTALDLTFGAALWLALALHAIGVELYVSSTNPISREESGKGRTRIHHAIQMLTYLRSLILRQQSMSASGTYLTNGS
jgi:hypothetical protein